MTPELYFGNFSLVLTMQHVCDFVIMTFCGIVWGLLGILSAIASPRMQVREQNQSRQRQNFISKNDYLFDVRSPYIQYGVNPSEVCDQFIYFVEYEVWKY